MSSHQGGGQSQVLASTSPSLFNAAGHRCRFHHRQLHAGKTKLLKPVQSAIQTAGGHELDMKHI